MGKTTEEFKISLNVSLKGSPKGVFPTKIFEIEIFHFKIHKKTLLFTQKLKIDIFESKVMSKNQRKGLICYQETHILLDVPSTD